MRAPPSRPICELSISRSIPSMAKNDVVELNARYALSPSLTFDEHGLQLRLSILDRGLQSLQHYGGHFCYDPDGPMHASPLATRRIIMCDGPIHRGTAISRQMDGYFCDPQLGCANRIVAQDLSDEHAWQLSQEFRLSSNFSGPLNFSVGGNYLHYETEENYLRLLQYDHDVYAEFIGQLNAFGPWIPNVSAIAIVSPLTSLWLSPSDPGIRVAGNQCNCIDPNPISNLNNEGHNYFLSQNPYVLNSYAGFGEVYYNVFHDLKLTGGLRWTDDQKHFVDIPSALITTG